jgi:hypothetical protein
VSTTNDPPGDVTHKTQGRDRHQTEGFILNRVYQAAVATTKTEQIMNRSVSLSVLEPDSRLSWNEVCGRSAEPCSVVKTTEYSLPREVVREI